MLAGSALSAQDRCHSTEYMDVMMQQHPEMAIEMAAIEEHTRQVLENGATERSASATYTIPVVFHVIYNGSSQNVPDNVILGQLDVLNEDFGAYNVDISTVIPAFSGIYADADIQFCLASVDPSGNPTTGITRTATSVSSFSYTGNGMKFNSSGGKDAWPRADYLNIWVCRLSGGVLGFAQFPGGPANTDGVVVDYRYVGRDSWTSGPLSPYNKGRTLTHEVGHWLNLRHIWGDGGCSVDDGVADTPLSSSPNYGCPLSSTRCSSLDNVQNYMDYTNDACMVMFTAGQGARMRATLVPGGSRASAANASATKCSSVVPTCDVPTMPSTAILSAPTTARVSWVGVDAAINYTVQGRQFGGAWRDVLVSGTGRNFNIFKANFTYEWRVRSNCGALGTSDYTAIQSFTMPASRFGVSSLAMNVFPNPASTHLVIDLNSEKSGSAELLVVDLLGQIVRTEQVAVDGGLTRVQLDVSQLNNGSYFVQMIQDGERVVSNFHVVR